MKNIFAEPVQRAFEELKIKAAEYVFFALEAIKPKEGFNQTAPVIALGSVNTIESFYDMINKYSDEKEFELIGYGNDPKIPDFLVVRESTGTEKYAIPLGKMPKFESMITSIKFAEIFNTLKNTEIKGIEDLRKQYPSTSRIEEIKTAMFAYGLTGTLVFRTNNKEHPVISSQDVFNAIMKAQNKVYKSEVLNGNKYAVTSIPTKDWRTFFTAYNGNLTSFPAGICTKMNELQKIINALHQSNEGNLFIDVIIGKEIISLDTPVGRYDYHPSAVGAINNVIIQSAVFAEKYKQYAEQYDAMTGKERADVKSAMVELCTIDYENTTAYPYAVVRAAGHLEKYLSFKGLLQLKDFCDKYRINKNTDVEMDIIRKMVKITDGEDRQRLAILLKEQED